MARSKYPRFSDPNREGLPVQRQSTMFSPTKPLYTPLYPCGLLGHGLSLFHWSLDSWHRKHGSPPPPFATNTADDPQRFKAYSRTDEQLDVYMVQITNPCTYKLLVIRSSVNWPYQVVVSDYRPRNSPVQNTFLLKWPVLDKGPTECFVIRTVGPHYTYYPKEWEFEDEGWKQIDQTESSEAAVPLPRALVAPEPDLSQTVESKAAKQSSQEQEHPPP
ncbi:hypothetical protein FE257_006961 [Aspergillus nanangensis]|uniref:Uncharacterized protein n=1 Tax=Aspergillus nanangensis TaxID=2582783 RepID=A0AAD4GUM3_ASPNN|nr:hypothetical protein FE257_006961 [Aspergillus nanangensis]